MHEELFAWMDSESASLLADTMEHSKKKAIRREAALKAARTRKKNTPRKVRKKQARRSIDATNHGKWHGHFNV